MAAIVRRPGLSPWAVAGDVLADYRLLIQSAELGGVWLLTLWVTETRRPCTGSPARSQRPGGYASPPWSSLWPRPVRWYGALRPPRSRGAHRRLADAQVAAVQPNVPQEVKWDPAFVDETYWRLSDQL